MRRPQHVLDGAVDVGVAAPALLVGERSGVPDARDHQTVTDAPDVLLVAREPDDRADGAGDEQQPVRVAERAGAEQTAERGEHRDPGQVVVRQRRMADMGREEHLFVARSGNEHFAVGERAGLERRVDADLVVTVLEPEQVVVGEAEAPALLVVRRAVGDEVGTVGQREEVAAEVRQCEALPHRCAVADEVQVRPGEVDDAIARCVLDEGVADVPLGRDDPVERGSARRDLVDVERELGAHRASVSRDSGTRDAPGDREEVDAELVHLGSVDGNVAAAHTASMPCFRRVPPTQSCCGTARSQRG